MENGPFYLERTPLNKPMAISIVTPCVSLLTCHYWKVYFILDSKRLACYDQPFALIGA